MEGHRDQNQLLNNFINNVINDLKNLSNSVRSLSRPAAQANNAIINRLLLGKDHEALDILKDILAHLLHIVDLKAINLYILGILTKAIGLIKALEQQQQGTQPLFEADVYAQEMNNILYHVIDIIYLFQNKYKDADMLLRIIQTTFSLIDLQLLQYANYHLLLRLYSICFHSSLTSPVIQNISLSALFALTEIVFSGLPSQDSSTILTHFLEYLLNNKKFSWIKDQQLKGLVWDLIIIGVRNFPPTELELIANNKVISGLLKDMYAIAIRKVFMREESKPQKGRKGQENKGHHKKEKESHLDFIRNYKTFVFLSVQLSIKCSEEQAEVVPFLDNIQLFKIVYELDRDFKLYVLLEGVSLLISQGSHLMVKDERPLLLLDILSKVIEQLCLSNVQLDISSEARELYLYKMCGDLTKVNDSDYAKLIRNTVIKLRKQFEGKIDKKVRTGQLLTERTELSENSESEVNDSSCTNSRRRWEKLISSVIRIIRYLTSLNLRELPSEQTVRKLIIELQYWYLICPSVRTRNLILHQLLNTSQHIDSKLQAIKASQCVQIASNLIYGYYQSLDPVGLTIILKMMARVKTTWEDGRGFQELDQVCTMSEKLYLEQNLVHNQKTFTKTVQAFVQSVNGLIADCEHSSKEDRFKKIGKNPFEQLLKMTEYIFSKLQIILSQNSEYIYTEWNFLTGFWLSLCCNPSSQIRQKTINHVGSVVFIMLKRTDVKQEVILSAFFELSKLKSLGISQAILSQLKQLLPLLHTQQAIVQVFRIATAFLETKGGSQFNNEVQELEEMLIKEVLFQVKSNEHLLFVIQSLSALNESKNEQYKTVSLLWNISDHLKLLASSQQLKDFEEVWKKLFDKLYWFGLNSIHGQTKQACLHSFTQILAESGFVLRPQTRSFIIRQMYLPLFLVLANLNPAASPVPPPSQPEMTKVGIKNFIKLTKKCILEQISQTADYLQQIQDAFLTEFPKINEKYRMIEYYYELCSLLQFFKALKEKYSENKVIINVEKTKQMLQLLQQNHKQLDQSSLFWRKKYEPVFKQLKAYFVC